MECYFPGTISELPEEEIMTTPQEILESLKSALVKRNFVVNDHVGNDVGFSAVSHNYEYSGIRITASPNANGIFVTICYKDATLNKKSESVIQRNFGNFFKLSDTEGAWMCISEELKSQDDMEKIAKILGDAYSSAVLVE
jgi:hypothetical protein